LTDVDDNENAEDEVADKAISAAPRSALRVRLAKRPVFIGSPPFIPTDGARRALPI
jgi:hypothetical protein